MSSAGLAAAIAKALGENASSQTVTHFIDTGYPPLNKAISGRYDGGYPCGRLVEIYGPSSAGKTLLATKAMAQAQKMGGVAIFSDHERSFEAGLAEAIGLSLDPNQWIYRTPGTWEEGNTEIAKAAKIIREGKFIDPEAPIVAVFDSIAAALPKSMADKDMMDYNMNDTTALARVTSTTLKSMARWAHEFNMTIIYLNQIRMAPGVMYGDPTTTPGGKSMEFYASVRLALGRKRLVDKETKEFLGQEVSIKTAKNKIAKPGQECTLPFLYDDAGVGYLDMVGGMVNYLTDSGKLASAGARVTWTDGKSYFKSALVKKLADENAYDQLVALLAA